MARPQGLEAKMVERGFLSTEFAAERTGYLVGSMTRLCSEGKVKAERTGRFWWIEKEALIQYLGGTPTIRDLLDGKGPPSRLPQLPVYPADPAADIGPEVLSRILRNDQQ